MKDLIINAIVAAAVLLPADFAAAQDATKGEQVFNQCKLCHRIGDGAKNFIGPVLTNVIELPFTPPAVHTAGVVVENPTVRPDDAVAVTTSGDWASVASASAANVIV